MSRRQKQTQEATAPEAQVVDLRDAFVELVGERWGYFAGKSLKAQEMNEQTEAQRKVANEAAKKLRESVTEYHGIVPSTETLAKMQEVHAQIQTETATKEEKAKALKEARKPFQEAISKLAKGLKYLDNVAIPDSLKEMGHPIAPRFNLSKWLAEAAKPKKKQ